MTRNAVLPAKRHASWSLAATVALLVLAAVGCQSDSPTAPRPSPTPGTPSGPPASTTWSIDVTISPNPAQLREDGAAVSATISVRVRRVSDGAPPPNNATIVLSTSGGQLSTLEGSTGLSVPLLLTGGLGQALLTLSGTEAATFIVQARIESSVGQAAVSFLGVDDVVETPLFVESVSPNNGPPTGGTRVSIRGTGFVSPIRVFFGGNAAFIRSSDETHISADTPPIDLGVGQIQTVEVRVDVGVNTAEAASDVLSNAFTYSRGDSTPPVPLRILSISPTSGPNEGGTQVTILGEGFAEEVQVFFGTQALIEATVLDVNPTRLIVVSPAAIGTNAINRDRLVDIRVINRDSGAEAVRVGAYQYGSPVEPVTITSVAPTQAPHTGGTLVEILGHGFDEPVAVGLAGFAQQIVSVTGTKVVVRTVAIDPTTCANEEGPVEIVNIETGAGATGPLFVFVVTGPGITNISPQVSPAGGGIPFTISGTNFEPFAQVDFDFPDGTVSAAGITVNSTGTAITGTLPAFFGDFDTEACNDNGDEQDGTREVPTAVSFTVENPITTCTDTFENVLIYNPPSSVCIDDVAPPPPPPPPPSPPNAAFHFIANGCTVTFFSDSTDTTSQSWNFGDGSAPSTAMNPTHTYTYAVGPASFTVVLSVTGPGGTDTDGQLINLMPATCP